MPGQAQKREVRIECDPAPHLSTIVSGRGTLAAGAFTLSLPGLSAAAGRDSVLPPAPNLSTGPFLRVQIEDEGEAIKDMERVFDPAESPRAGKTDLNELGIIIGRRLLEVMKGTVTLENRKSGGLRTLIELPAGPLKVETSSRLVVPNPPTWKTLKSANARRLMNSTTVFACNEKSSDFLTSKCLRRAGT